MQAAKQDLEAARSEIDQSNNNTSALLQSILTNRENKEELEAEASHLKEKMEEANDKILKLEQQAESFDSIKKDYQKIAHNLQSKVSNLEAQMSAQEEKHKEELMSTKKEAEQQHRKELLTLIGGQSQAEMRAKNAEMAEVEAERRARDLEKQLQAAKQNLEAARAEADQSKKNSETLLLNIGELTEKIAKLGNTAREWEAKSKQLQSEKEDAEKSCTSIKQLMSTKKEAEQQHWEQLSASIEDKSKAIKRAAEAEKASAEAEARARDLEKRLQEDKQHLEASMSDQNKVIADLRERVKTLSGQLVASQMDSVQRQEDHRIEKKKTEEAQRRLKEGKKEHLKLQEIIDEKQEQLLKVESEKIDLEVEKGRLETQIGHLNASLQCQRQEVKQLENSLTNSRDLIRKLRTQDDQSVASSGTAQSGGNQRSRQLLKIEKSKVKGLMKENEELQKSADGLKQQLKAVQEEGLNKDAKIAEMTSTAQTKNGIIIGLKEEVIAEKNKRLELQAQLAMMELPPIGQLEFDRHTIKSQNIDDFSDIEFDDEEANKFEELGQAYPPAIPAKSPLAATLQAPGQPQPIQEQPQSANKEKMEGEDEVFTSLLSPGANGQEEVMASDTQITAPGAIEIVGRKRKMSRDEQDENSAPFSANVARKFVVRRDKVHGPKPAPQLLLPMQFSVSELNSEEQDKKRTRIDGGAPLVIPAGALAGENSQLVAKMDWLESSETVNPESNLGNNKHAKKPAATTEQDDMNVFTNIPEVD